MPFEVLAAFRHAFFAEYFAARSAAISPMPRLIILLRFLLERDIYCHMRQAEISLRSSFFPEDRLLLAACHAFISPYAMFLLSSLRPPSVVRYLL